MIQVDNRIGGVEPRYILHPDGTEVRPLVRVPDGLLQCVVFIGYRQSAGVEVPAGTGFFLHRATDQCHTVVYLVTAKHNINQIRASGSNEVLVRCNLVDGGARWYTTKISDWHFHPDEDEVDIAVAQLSVPEGAQHASWALSSSATNDVITDEGIGVGDEVFLAGLFRHHYGSYRSCPIVRIGNIAALPDERIVVPEFGLIDAYLIEVRSMGGLSGCPVFVQQGERVLAVSHSMQTLAQEMVLAHQRPLRLLGLMHGHFATGTTQIDGLNEDTARRDEINMGIAIVVPAYKIIEVTAQPFRPQPKG